MSERLVAIMSEQVVGIISEYLVGIIGIRNRTSEKYERFARTTGIYLDNGISIDTSIYREDWHGVGPTVVIVCADFKEARQRRPPAQRSLFEMVA